MKYTTEEAIVQIHLRQTGFREKMRIGTLLLVVLLVILSGLEATRNEEKESRGKVMISL